MQNDHNRDPISQAVSFFLFFTSFLSEAGFGFFTSAGGMGVSCFGNVGAAAVDLGFLGRVTP